MEQTFNIAQAIAAQQKLIKDKPGGIDFAPRDGRCWNCKRNIYNEVDHGTYKTGISVERAGVEGITGCPHCHRSYCD